MFILIFKLLRLYERFIHQIYSFLIKKQLKFCGKKVLLKKGVMLVYPQNIHLDDYTQIGEYTQIKAGAKIKIGKYCQIASFVIIATGNHIIDGNLYYGNVVDKEIVIGNNVWVASNSIILPGVKILGFILSSFVILSMADLNFFILTSPSESIFS